MFKITVFFNHNADLFRNALAMMLAAGLLTACDSHKPNTEAPQNAPNENNIQFSSSNPNSCLKVIETKIGVACKNPNSMMVTLKNICDTKIRARLCIQNDKQQWICNATAVEKDRAFFEYSCTSTGYYWYSGCSIADTTGTCADKPLPNFNNTKARYIHDPDPNQDDNAKNEKIPKCKALKKDSHEKDTASAQNICELF